MSVASTSRIAHQAIEPSLNSRRAELLGLLATAPDLTNGEMAEALRLDPSQVSPRCLELREMGKVEFSRIRSCGRTGHTAKAWRITTGV